MTCRKRRDDVKTAGESLLRDQLRRYLFTDGVASGINREAVERNVGTWDSDVNGEAISGRTTRARVRKRSPGTEQPVVAKKFPKGNGAKGLCYGVLIQ
jgi:hypothetical protein